MLAVAALDAAARGEMLALLERHFEGVRADEFEADLEEKDQAVLLRAEGGRLVGFSTLRVYRTTAAGAARRVLFSGDTIVDPEAWRSPEAIRAWLRGVLPLASAAPEPLDWFLLSSGHRTYRIMTTLFEVCHPDPRAARPALAARLAAYARERYGAAYDAAAGVVRLPRSIHRLRPGVGDLTEARLKDPAAAHFARLNPGHAAGDELCCLCELSPDNLSRAGRRVLGSP
jgi:hypothetical protein